MSQPPGQQQPPQPQYQVGQIVNGWMWNGSEAR